MKLFFAAFLLLGTLSVFAQTEKKRLTYTSSANISPFALADVDHGIMAGGEYRFRPNMSASMDAAYIFFTNYYQEAKSTRGFNIRPAFRFYFGKKQHEFLQLQGFFKHVDYRMYGWVGKECVNDVPSYNELQNYTLRKKVTGFNLMVGDLLPISDRMYIDIGVGLGVRFKEQHILTENACIPPQPTNFIDRYNRHVTAMSLPFSVKFAYIIK
jgi:hypothetical protein